MLKKLFLTNLVLVLLSISAQMKAEMLTIWNRAEYKEWAKPIENGYELFIIRAQQTDYLVARATLIMGLVGLPTFELLEQIIVSTEDKAFAQIKLWQDAAQ